ncbi:hypothetical protein AVEN_90459-1 [Araneus ventricosus]|uniref:DUF7041 domain-containing protein n=1 Tax=Araneus ventricosus TaxID=182803 RepID=A0A4Y2JBM5_ARAVE|nr:hypothetical protein AVEN_90459-1 [Araneus ventricosus]
MSKVGAVKISVYNRSYPALWFIMCESTFKLAVPKPITESMTKFNYVVSPLPPEVASLVRDILMNPDATDPYTHLKTELINRCFIPKAEHIVAPIVQFLEVHTNKKKSRSSVRKSSEQLKWNENAEQVIAEATLLRYPIPGTQLSL